MTSPAQSKPVAKPQDRAAVLASGPEGERYATITQALSADRRNVAQKDLAEAQTAQACVATVAQAKAADIEVKLPKVCEKYVQKVRQEPK
jgi:hypothetical protein